MDILKSLGVDFATLGIQLVCFLISYLSLHFLILKPYSAALKERENRTVGNEETAVRLIDEASDLHSEYETKARSINSEIKAYFDQSRKEALKDYEGLVVTARAQADQALAQSRAHIASEIQSARRVLSAEVPTVSAAIASKLAGKEISL